MIPLLLSTAALAGEGLLSGGLSVSPTALSIVVPSWRLGYSGGRFTAWGSASWTSFTADPDDPDTVSGFLLRPRIGAQLGFGDRGEEAVVPYVAAGASTLLFGLSLDEERPLEEERVEARLPFGLTGGFGLDAGITEVLSVSTEVGVDWASAGFTDVDDDYTVGGSTFLTYAAVHLNLWL